MMFYESIYLESNQGKSGRSKSYGRDCIFYQIGDK